MSYGFQLRTIDYKNRRERALDLISESALLVMAMPEATRNSDVEHYYRQESLMQYLTGFAEPESALLLTNSKTNGRQSILFTRPRNEEAELWTGKRLGVESAPAKLGIDAAYSIESIWEELPKLLVGVDKLYYSFGRSEEADLGVIVAIKRQKHLRGRHSLSSVIPVFDADMISGPLRLQKTPEELDRLRAAAEISRRAYDVVFKSVKPGMNERQVQGILIGEFMKNGAEMEAYPGIIAGGANACCLHYRDNNSILRDGELLLIDAGAQFEYYASDVTRTFPVGKKFTSEQRQIYELVLGSQLHAIDLAREKSSMQAIHDATCRYLTEGLMSLGFLKGASLEEHLEKKNFRKYYPHGTGHWLGMDVHDVGDYISGSDPLGLKEGMCFTIEPGIYIPSGDDSVPAGFRGIGIRIEDDIVINKSGAPAEILTSSIPKSVDWFESRL